MSEITPPQRLGRRMNHLLVDRSLFAWTHRLLGVIAGCTCVITAISTHRLLFFRRGVTMWFSRAGGSASALVFFMAALPFVVSYLNNIELVDEKFTRTALFAFGLVAISFSVDALTIIVLRGEYSTLALVALYFGQAIAYIGLGRITLGPEPDSDIFSW
jgi:hypothetical protein